MSLPIWVPWLRIKDHEYAAAHARRQAVAWTLVARELLLRISLIGARIGFRGLEDDVPPTAEVHPTRPLATAGQRSRVSWSKSGGLCSVVIVLHTTDKYQLQ